MTGTAFPWAALNHPGPNSADLSRSSAVTSNKEADMSARQTNGKQPGLAEQEYVRELVRRVGLSAASRTFGISRLAVASVAAGFEVHVGTIEVVRAHRQLKGSQAA